MNISQALRILWKYKQPPPIDRRTWQFYKRDLNAKPGLYPGYEIPRSASQLQKDLNKASDSLIRQQHTNDVLASNLLYQRAISTLLLWAFGITWSGIGGLLIWLAPFAVKGMAK